MWANALTHVTAPYGLLFSHKRDFPLGKLALPLRYGGKAIRPLTAENSRRAGALARAAPLAVLRGHRLACRKELGGEVGKKVGNENVAAVFLVDNQPVISYYAQPCRKRGTDLVNGAVVTLARKAPLGVFGFQRGDKPVGNLAYCEVIVKRGGVA